MSCPDCERIQDLVDVSPAKMPENYVRVGIANIRVIGCDKHLKELIGVLNCHQAEENLGLDKLG